VISVSPIPRGRISLIRSVCAITPTCQDASASSGRVIIPRLFTPAFLIWDIT
jgi:hypothetical protein